MRSIALAWALMGDVCPAGEQRALCWQAANASKLSFGLFFFSRGGKATLADGRKVK